MRKKSILSIIVIVLMIGSYILFRNLTSLFSSKTPLYVNLQKDDLIKIQTLLKEKRFEYKIEGNSIYVNKDRIDEIKSVMPTNLSKWILRNSINSQLTYIVRLL